MKVTNKELNNLISWINDNTVGLPINNGMPRIKKIEYVSRYYYNDKIISNELKELMPDWLKKLMIKLNDEA